MIQLLQKNWRIYLIEAWALGMFMVSAAAFVILLEHPALGLKQALPSAFFRRFLVGLAMGLTAVLLIYSPWGKKSGAHMNPAVTLTFLQLDRIRLEDALWYIIAQFVGGALAVYLFKWFLFPYISDASVNYVTTVPGAEGVVIAIVLEALLSFTMFLMVLIISNHPRLAPYTGYFVGILLTFFITFEAPYSGMSINPARTVASALPANLWTGWWLYFIGPVAGMQLAGLLYRRWYRRTHDDNCLPMRCHMSGDSHDSPTYEVLGPRGLIATSGMPGDR